MKSRTPTLFWSGHLKIQGRSIFKGVHMRTHTHTHVLSHVHKRNRDGRLKCAMSGVQIREQPGPLGKVKSLLARAVMTVGYYAEDTLMTRCATRQQVSREEGQACAFSRLAQFLRGGPERLFI